MDPGLQRRYLEAMGIRVWRLRAVPRDGDTASQVPSNLGPSAQSGAPAGGLDGGEKCSLAVSAETEGAVLPLAREKGVGSMDWGPLRDTVADCRACSLCDTRTQTVFGVGNPDADLMIIGEAPGADEDRRGEPFVGRAGQLLNLMLTAIGLQRSEVYVANVLKCRPPGNRDPRPEEAAACRGFLMRQIALVRPRVVLSVGRISAQNLLATDAPVGRLRGRWFEFGPGELPLTVTYHPSYLLRSPEQKAKAWQDLLQVARRLRSEAGRSAAE